MAAGLLAQGTSHGGQGGVALLRGSLRERRASILGGLRDRQHFLFQHDRLTFCRISKAWGEQPQKPLARYFPAYMRSPAAASPLTAKPLRRTARSMPDTAVPRSHGQDAPIRRPPARRGALTDAGSVRQAGGCARAPRAFCRRQAPLHRRRTPRGRGRTDGPQGL